MNPSLEVSLSNDDQSVQFIHRHASGAVHKESLNIKDIKIKQSHQAPQSQPSSPPESPKPQEHQLVVHNDMTDADFESAYIHAGFCGVDEFLLLSSSSLSSSPGSGLCANSSTMVRYGA
mmetsp:Transcript_37171/g.57087  ORF Transcript_37171/g.57087 Transcript_37171/m.57087 type:complete len:119 (-) Transcript_37171:73-429(-)